MEQEEEVEEKEGGGRSRRGKWNNGISHVCSRVHVGLGAPTAH